MSKTWRTFWYWRELPGVHLSTDPTPSAAPLAAAKKGRKLKAAAGGLDAEAAGDDGCGVGEGLVANSILFYWLFTIKDQHRKGFYISQQSSLRQLFLTVTRDIGG